MDYGKDILLDKNGDIVFENNDIKIIEGPGLIVQDIQEEIRIPRGSVPWDLDAGSDIYNYLNSNDVSDQTIIDELERIAKNDYRTDITSIYTEKVGNKFILSFRPLEGGPEEKLEIEEVNNVLDK